MTATADELENGRHPPGAHPDADTVPKPSPAAKVVLVADDNVDGADSLSMILVHCGCKVHIAYDGLTAMASAESVRPDIAVLDIAMPGASGHEVARWIRQQDWGRAMRLVALTAFGGAGDIERSREAGFDLHLHKPAGAYEVMEALGMSFDGSQGNANP